MSRLVHVWLDIKKAYIDVITARCDRYGLPSAVDDLNRESYSPQEHSQHRRGVNTIVHHQQAKFLFWWFDLDACRWACLCRTHTTREDNFKSTSFTGAGALGAHSSCVQLNFNSVSVTSNGLMRGGIDTEPPWRPTGDIPLACRLPFGDPSSLRTCHRGQVGRGGGRKAAIAEALSSTKRGMLPRAGR